MGSRFTFDPPQHIYDVKYAEVAKAIEADLFTYRWDVIDALEREFHNPDAVHLHQIASRSDSPDMLLRLVALGIFGKGFRDQMTLAIGHVADYLTKNYVRGFWPEWERA